VTIEADIEGGLWHVIAASSQIEQVVLNLASNARDAMPGGGTFRVVARNRGPRDASAPGVEGKEHVEIVVSDTGVGMTPETLEHVFEPFFTTKQAGLGTGLGLATCFGIVEQLHGRMTVASQAGHGTSFTLLLPRASGDGAARMLGAEARTSDRALWGAPATVLVVDDDDAILGLMTRVVKSLGHEALPARTLDEAVAHARASRVDVLLTDIMLGAESGLDALRRVRAEHPNAGVVLTSGYVKDAEEIARHVAAGVEFVPKPFTTDALAAALGRATVRRPAAVS
jgi:CheY-like chemotaxis protein